MWNKWKTALIAVFNDKTTLTAPMADWLNKQNHQKSQPLTGQMHLSAKQWCMVTVYTIKPWQTALLEDTSDSYTAKSLLPWDPVSVPAGSSRIPATPSDYHSLE
jgi:hypothetical protein